MTISEPLTVGGLILGGGDSAVTMTVRNTLQVNGDLYVGKNATLVLDVPSYVSGSVLLDDGAKITHTKGATSEKYKVDLTVGGSMLVSQGASINVSGKGYQMSYGPGCGVLGKSGASHGGRGCNINNEPIPNCYGSYLKPINYGSGGGRDNCNGGGAVKLDVAGVLFVDGSILADGSGSETIYNASGGSVYVKCLDFCGSGTITALGQQGYYSDDLGYMASGGRISIQKTSLGDFSNWLGSVSAHGSFNNRGTSTTWNPQGSAGTIAWVRSGTRPRIVIDNLTNNANGACYGSDLPVINGESKYQVRDFDIVLKNAGRLYLTSDVTVWDVSLESSNTKIFLNGHTLALRSRAHLNRAGWKGSVSTGTGGQIVWKPLGFSVSLR